MKLWTVYQNPSNHDEEFAAREFQFDKATPKFFAHDDLEKVRAWVLDQGGAFMLMPDPKDDPVILETWV